MALALARRNTIFHALLPALLAPALLLVGTLAVAADIRWRNPSGGTFSSAGSWFGSVVPGAGDTAHFGLTVQSFPPPIPESYTVNFTNDPTTGGLRIEDDFVTFNLNGHTYSLVFTSAAAQVGNISGENGGLTITNGLVDGFSTMPMFVGLSGGGGTLNINSFGRLKSFFGSVGHDSGGAATVSGANSEWVMAGDLNVGRFAGGAGTLNVLGGGRVQSDGGAVGIDAGSTGTVTVSDAGSEWVASDHLAVGHGSTGTLNVLAGGALTTSGVTIALGSTANGTVTIDGEGSSWLNSADVVVGHFGVGTLNITGGAGALNRDAFIGRQPPGSGTVIVEGAGSLWNILGVLNIGTTIGLAVGGQGNLRIRPGASVVVTQRTQLGIDDALHLEGGELSTPEVRFDGANKPFFWTSGTLRDVRRFDTNMTVPTGGILEPVHATGTTLLTGTEIFGNYDQQAAGSTLAVDIGGSTPLNFDLVNVHGAALLGGNLQVTLSTSFIPTNTNTFHILEAIGDITTSFANVANGQRVLTTNGLGSFRVSYGPASAFGPFAANDIILDQYVSIVLPGDYNNNGAVDAADYILWRNGGPLANETETLNFATPEDYAVWRAHFGMIDGSASAAANVAVPEPLTSSLLLAALSAATFLRRPSHR
jgi:T5SS/PEP-CTERM-associated repeat protein